MRVRVSIWWVCDAMGPLHTYPAWKWFQWAWGAQALDLLYHQAWAVPIPQQPWAAGGHGKWPAVCVSAEEDTCTKHHHMPSMGPPMCEIMHIHGEREAGGSWQDPGLTARTPLSCLPPQETKYIFSNHLCKHTEGVQIGCSQLPDNWAGALTGTEELMR